MDSPRGRRLRPQPPEPIEARYANYFEVGHNAYEFILDFAQYQPRGEAVRLQTRIVMSPVFAKLLLGLLAHAVEQFETDHGAIEEASDELDPLELVKQSINGYERRPETLSGGSKRRKPR